VGIRNTAPAEETRELVDAIEKVVVAMTAQKAAA